MSFVNFDALQTLSAVDTTDELLISLDNALSGIDGFGRVTVQNLEQSLTVYATVQSNSAAWAVDSTIDSGVRTLTSNWQNTYTSFATQSANNGSVYSAVNSNSANWTQTLTFDANNATLSISNGNSVSLSALSASSTGGSGVPNGGSIGQTIVKTGAADGQAAWANRRITLTLSPVVTANTVSITSNALSADQFVVVLSGASLSATIAAPISAYDAQIIMWNLRYTTNIARVSVAAAFRTPITTLNWTVSANRMDIMAAKYNALDSKWDIISFAPGYII